MDMIRQVPLEASLFDSRQYTWESFKDKSDKRWGQEAGFLQHHTTSGNGSSQTLSRKYDVRKLPHIPRNSHIDQKLVSSLTSAASLKAGRMQQGRIVHMFCTWNPIN